MKKVISSIASLVLAAAISTSAFAANPITTLNGTDTHVVNGTYAASGTMTVYKLDIAWGSMDFTYNAASTGTWNPNTHAYTGASAANWSWADNTNKIAVTNHSNAAVEATLNFSSTISGMTGVFYDATKNGSVISGSKLSLATAVGTSVSAAPKANAYLQITNGSISSDVQIGNVTVTLK